MPSSSSGVPNLSLLLGVSNPLLLLEISNPSSLLGILNPLFSSLLCKQVKTTNINIDDNDSNFISNNKSTILRSHWKDMLLSSLQFLENVNSSRENTKIINEANNSKYNSPIFYLIKFTLHDYIRESKFTYIIKNEKQ